MCVWGLATLGPASWTVKRESRRGPATRSQPGVRTVKGCACGVWRPRAPLELDDEWGQPTRSEDLEWAGHEGWTGPFNIN